MRWESLFADLEAQLSHAEEAELTAELAERARGEWARTTLADRVRACVGSPLRVVVIGGEQVRGTCQDVGPDWLVLAGDRGQVLVPFHAVAWVDGLGRAVAPAAGQVLRRLGLAHALRALARDRAAVRVLTTGGHVTGTIDRVGADHVDLAEHPPGEPRRAGSVRSVLGVPFTAVLAIAAA